MAYSDFSLDKLEDIFAIKSYKASLFADSRHIEPSEKLKEDILEANNLMIRTEKAKSEWIVVPILKELRRINNNFFTIYSGEFLDVNKEVGLNGECDFMLAKDTGTYGINSPIMQVVEAKKNDIDFGIPQCASQMLGAKFFNEKKNTVVPKLYGCVTTGDEWLFMLFHENKIEIDTKRYYLNDIGHILGVFQEIDRLL
jgi:hypothetical protein